MENRPRLGRARIKDAFRIMGQYLLDRKTLGEIAIYGGSAILLQFDWRKTSIDVDPRVIGAGNHGLIVDAIHEAARRLDLPRSWFNDSVVMYARRGEGDADCVLIGLYPSPERFGLRVMAAKPAYILAMKLRALERVTADDRDYQDAVELAVECGARPVDDLKEVVRKFFGNEALLFATELRLEQLAKAVGASLAGRGD
jgi:hypothetical protein